MNLKEHEDLVAKVEKAKGQIALLRKQQLDLEREKASLEELKNKQEEWDRGKGEVGDALRKAVVFLENQESDLERMRTLAHDTRESFSSLLDQLGAINESRWTPENLKEELMKSLLIVERARKELSVARAQIPALGRGGEVSASAAAEEPGRYLGHLEAAELLRVGFWLALPIALMVAAILVVISLL